MTDTLKVTIVKSFSYRGAPEEWTNSYHFLGPDPDDWDVPVSNLARDESMCLPGAVTYKRAYCYAVHDDATRGPVTKVVDISGLSGSFDPSGLGLAGFSGDVAATVRWATDQFTTGRHPKRIYLRKYFHSVFGAADPVSDQDALAAEQKTLMETFGTEVASPDPYGLGDFCGPRGAVAGAHLVSPWVTTRTLKRRGRRPPA